jgi:glycosyltransferase involved in cell wall biosynthesis
MNFLKITIVTPVFNEELVIGSFYSRLNQVLNTLINVDHSILFVVDRCSDKSLSILRDIVEKDSSVKVLSMSSRFGHQMSLIAGIEHSKESDVIVMMDSDLQHPPELIPELIENFKKGYEVVYTIRNDTEGIGSVRKFAGNIFYYLLGYLSQVPISANASDFRLISRRVASVLVSEFHERNMFLRGIFTWMGFKQVGVEYVAQKRYAGSSKYSVSKILQFAIDGILSFSTKPLHMAVALGAFFSFAAFILIAIATIRYFIVESIPSGFTTLVVLLLLFNGTQLVVMGIMGAYIGGIYQEVKKRPRYIVDEVISKNDHS